ncbi:MAG TPA: twin-arginine translocase TatA/TatE family subunit, partial [Nitrospirae bacterium]|nr:twin-arginine translocase TatA/TatE family subunit [Nitrospirota bacterium]
TELIIILVIIVILFGARRLPEIGRGVGEAIKNFKKSTSEPSEIDVTPEKKNEGSEENAARVDSDRESKS